MRDARSAFRTPAGFAAIAICATTWFAMVWRMRFGIDFTDEAFYLALPLRFTLGDRPFVDEMNIAQTAGLLIYPFVRVYTAIAGTTGLVLYIRFLYLVFFGLVGWSAYALAKTRLSRPAALLCGTACICFIPYGIPGLSYNTVSMGLFALGLFVLARWLLIAERTPSVVRSPVFWAGVAHAAAVFAYPSLLLGVLATAAAAFALASGERIRTTLLYAAGGVAFCILVSPLFLAAGAANLRALVAYSGGAGATSAFTLDMASARLTEFLAQHPELPFAAFAAAVAMSFARRYPLVTACAAPFLPLLARGSLLRGPQASLGFVACLALLAPILSLGLRDRRTARVLFVGIGVPAGVAGTVSALSSTNGAVAAALGLFPAAILTAIVLAMFVDETLKSGHWTTVRPYLALGPAVGLWAFFQYLSAQDTFYRDGPRAQLTAKVVEGPYKGIYTLPIKRDTLRWMAEDIRTYGGRSARAAFVYDLPVGYLIASRRPLVASSWIFSLPTRIGPDAQYFRTHAKSGDLIFVDRFQPRMPLDQAILELADPVASRGGVWVYTAYVVR